MANIDTYKERMQNIANAIRGKTGKTDKLTLAQMPAEVESIPSGGGNYNGAIDFSKYGSGNEVVKSLTSLDLSGWDTSSITDMSRMFYYCSSLPSLDLSSFNTSNVTKMVNMFSDCSKLTSLDLSSFNTSNVTDMSEMFSSCSSLTSLDLSSFDTQKVTNMGNYSWEKMFDYCPKLTTLTLGNNWASNTSVTSFDLSSCPLTHDSCLDVFNKLADRTASPATLTLNSTTKALMSEDEIKIATDKGWTVS